MVEIEFDEGKPIFKKNHGKSLVKDKIIQKISQEIIKITDKFGGVSPELWAVSEETWELMNEVCGNYLYTPERPFDHYLICGVPVVRAEEWC